MKKTASIAFVLMCLLMVFTTGCSTPLHKALIDGNVGALKQNIKAGANVNAKDSGGQTPLAIAALSGNLEAVKVLVDNGADVNSKDKNGVTPLIFATRLGLLDVVKVLVEHGADVNAKANGGDSLVRVSEGWNMVINIANGATPMTIAAAEGRHEVVEFLKQHGAKE